MTVFQHALFFGICFTPPRFAARSLKTTGASKQVGMPISSSGIAWAHSDISHCGSGIAICGSGISIYRSGISI